LKPYVVGLLVVVAILAGFYGGYKVGHSNVSASTNTQTPTARAGNGFGGTRGLGAACPSPGATPSAGTRALASGTISNLSSSSLTVTNPNCEVKVTFGTTVTISRQVAGSTTDLKDNLTVTIVGTRQADGSILAQTIQIGSGTLGGGPGTNGPGTTGG
jgi:hypothetical protein